MSEALPSTVQNLLPEGTGTCFLSDIPIDFSTESEAVSQEGLNLMLSTFAIHGFTVKTQTEGHFGVKVQIPANIENDFKGSLSLGFLLDDKLDNYWTLYRYARTLISPLDGFPINNKELKPHRAGAYANRRMYIDEINVHVGDASLELTNIYTFERCYLSTFGDIEFNFTGTGPAFKPLSTTWTYDNINFRRVPKDCSIPNSIGD
jgi:hypothetical protein